MRMMKFFLQWQRNLVKYSSWSMIELYSFHHLRLSVSMMKPLWESNLPNLLTLSVKHWVTLKFKMCLLLSSSSLLKLNGSLVESAPVPSLLHAIRNQAHKRRSWERSLSSFVTKTLQWSEEHALQDLVISLSSLTNNTFYKIFSQFSDNCPRMSKIQLESCAWNHWFKWLIIYPRKRIKFIPLEHSLLLVRTNLGKYDLLSLEILPPLQNHLVKKSLTTTLFRHSPYF